MNTYNPTEESLQNSELGKKSAYLATYNPNLLFAISRDSKREEIGVNPKNLPFYGFDCWNHYEVSWLNEKGKPMVALAEIIYDCHTPNIVESKSLKLYFNSFNNTQVKDIATLTQTIKTDLEQCVQGKVEIKILPFNHGQMNDIHPHFTGFCLDELDISCDEYIVNPALLKTKNTEVTETLYSNLLKSNCLVTHQPDWGSVQISYKGMQIDHTSLLQYLVSFRNHNEFHEQCIERIFVDIMKHCQPEELTVYGRYTRRGGLDINPYRSTSPVLAQEHNRRLVRQ